jgi:hypothetical protein
MKIKSLVPVIVLLPFIGCKKDSGNISAPIDITVSGLTAKTSISITAVDETESNKQVLQVTNQYGNTTYHTAIVSAGDKIKITVTANMDDNLQGDGDGSFQFMFKGRSVGGHSGQINRVGFTQDVTAIAN